MGRVAVILTNYNMPERAEALATAFRRYVKAPHDLYLIDNGSDIAPIAPSTTHRLDRNTQTTGGWLYGLQCADAQDPYDDPYTAYMFLITSAEYAMRSDMLAPMVDYLDTHPRCVGIHPALTKDSTTSWYYLITNGKTGTRRVPHIDNIASLYRADWFDGIGRFDPALTYAHGIDLETCWKARRDGKTLIVCEDAKVKKVTDIGYKMERMHMTAAERQANAEEEMRRNLGVRYGADYWGRLQHEYWSANDTKLAD